MIRVAASSDQRELGAGWFRRPPPSLKTCLAVPPVGYRVTVHAETEYQPPAVAGGRLSYCYIMASVPRLPAGAYLKSPERLQYREYFKIIVSKLRRRRRLGRTRCSRRLPAASRCNRLSGRRFPVARRGGQVEYRSERRRRLSR